MRLDTYVRKGRVVLPDEAMHMGDHGSLEVRVFEIRFEPHIVLSGVGREAIALRREAPDFGRDVLSVDPDDALSWLVVLLDRTARRVVMDAYLRVRVVHVGSEHSTPSKRSENSSCSILLVAGRWWICASLPGEEESSASVRYNCRCRRSSVGKVELRCP